MPAKVLDVGVIPSGLLMEVSVNGRNRRLDTKAATVQELFEVLSLEIPLFIVEVNGRVVLHEDYPNVPLAESDHIKVYHLVVGG